MAIITIIRLLLVSNSPPTNSKNIFAPWEFPRSPTPDLGNSEVQNCTSESLAHLEKTSDFSGRTLRKAFSLPKSTNKVVIHKQNRGKGCWWWRIGLQMMWTSIKRRNHGTEKCGWTLRNRPFDLEKNLQRPWENLV